jgi:DNA-directed RNA polymerase subunit beta'
MAVIAAEDGTIEFKDDVRNKHKFVLHAENGEEIDYSITKGVHINVQDGDFVRKGDEITDGELSPHDILRVLGIEELAKYLVKEVQEVYRLQGVEINDKHIECIIRQMLKKKEVVNPGATTFLTGEVVDVKSLIIENEKAIAAGGEPAKVKDVLLGITKSAGQSGSFISAASFQETTRVITEAAIAGKEDYLNALKENVIVGRLIPAGTGAYVNEVKKLAKKKDMELANKKSEGSVEAEMQEGNLDMALPGLE